ncbi:MAG: YncE family protein [Bacteroidetes bacterium]|nr:YncE family protein [Bacteroidota bacterium]
MKSGKILRSLLFTAGLSTAFWACQKDNDPGEVIQTQDKYIYGQGVFIVNEGNFLQGNGSVFFFNEERNTLFKDIFYTMNQRPLGDVPTFMGIWGSSAYIVVNNSSKIEVVNKYNFISSGTITGMTSPRQILKVNDSKAYVSDLQNGGLHVIDLDGLKVSGFVDLGKSAEALVFADNKVFAANWSNFYVQAENNTVQVIDPMTDQLAGEITVTKEPNSMVVDKNGKLWVLCSGGFMNEEIPALYRIDPQDLEIERKIEFPLLESSPTSLKAFAGGDSLIFLNPEVYVTGIEDTVLSSSPFISAEGRFFYSLFTDPVHSWIYVSDAVDFQQEGSVLVFDRKGRKIREVSAGIVPGGFCYTE